MKKSRRIDCSPWSKPNCNRKWSVAQRVAYYSRPDPLSGCHIWDGALRRGYGSLRYQGRTLSAHRLAWEAKYGPIPDGMIVRHRCNVRRCVNPDHFVLGTHAENTADIKAAQFRFADVRAATAKAAPGSNASARPIRIFYDGIELIGDVTIKVVDPRRP
jgi:hypothetical protein